MLFEQGVLLLYDRKMRVIFDVPATATDVDSAGMGENRSLNTGPLVKAVLPFFCQAKLLWNSKSVISFVLQYCI